MLEIPSLGRVCECSRNSTPSQDLTQCKLPTTNYNLVIKVHILIRNYFIDSALKPTNKQDKILLNKHFLMVTCDISWALKVVNYAPTISFN